MAISTKGLSGYAASWANSYNNTGSTTAANAAAGKSTSSSSSKSSSSSDSGGNLTGPLWDTVASKMPSFYAAANNFSNKTTGQPQQWTEQQEEQQQQQQQDEYSQNYINAMKQAQIQSRIAALDKAKSSAITALDTEKANVSPTYYDKRNQAAANSDVGALNFAQYMAARGIKGAAGAMPEIYRNAGLQGQIGALDRQEASELSAIEKQRANVETGYASDVAAANADAEAQAMQAAINQYNADRAYKAQQAAAELEQQKFDWSKSSSNPTMQYQALAAKKLALDNAAQEIQNSYLPDTLKQQAQLLQYKVDSGSLDYDTALAQLEQIKAQTSKISSSGSGGGGSSGGSASEDKSLSAMNTWVTKQVSEDPRLLPDMSNYNVLYNAWKTTYSKNMYGG